MYFCVVRSAHKIKKWFLEFCYSKEPEYNAIEYFSHSLGSSDVTWSSTVPSERFYFYSINQNFQGFITTKTMIWYAGQTIFYPTESIGNTLLGKIFNTPIKTPWLWIGDSTNDMTNRMEEYVVAGNVIKPDLLKYIDSTIEKWYYMDPSTLEVVEFPTDGITIEHDNSQSKED